VGKKNKKPDRCVICLELSTNRNLDYYSGSFYFNAQKKKVFYCADCLREPKYFQQYQSERALNAQNYPKTRSSNELAQWQKGPLGWAPLAIVVILFLWMLVYGISNYEPELDNPQPITSGEQQEWNADNSIDGPAGTFDDQSKR
jgi:hypothetical protein